MTRRTIVSMAMLAALAGPDVVRADEGTLDAERGRRLMATHQCGACHAIPGVAGARSQAGPSLDKYGLRSYIAGRLPNRADILARWIADPQGLIPDATMPSMGVSPVDARDMAHYLGTLR